MFIEKVKTEGLAHLSYVVGSDGDAAVIDPRRDCETYIDIASRNGCRISRVFETHRNEDLLSGSVELAARTGATVYHGPDAAGDVEYAKTVTDGDEFEIGSIDLCVLETPGHTDDSLSFALYDKAFGEGAFAVFTGDTLFVGDVGRTDFYPDRAREVAGLLFDSLRKLESLGKQAVIYPAHGAGSVCGSGMASREVSTIGHEKANNPRLRISDREDFIAAKLAENHDRPPYFEYMERGNLEGAPPLPASLQPPPLTPRMLSEMADDGAVLVDVRSPSAFLGAHLPSSLSLPEAMISAFAGWFLDPDRPIVLIADDGEQAARSFRHLLRIGFDRVRGYLGPNLAAWAAGGGDFGTVPVVDAAEVHERYKNRPENWTLLDVRNPDEVRKDRIEGAINVFLGELQRPRDELDPSRRYTVMCASGARATIAASLLRRSGIETVDLFLGSLGAWKQEGLDTRDAA
jgi:hydroxyacylglutathione hydrolase